MRVVFEKKQTNIVVGVYFKSYWHIFLTAGRLHACWSGLNWGIYRFINRLFKISNTFEFLFNKRMQQKLKKKIQIITD